MTDSPKCLWCGGSGVSPNLEDGVTCPACKDAPTRPEGLDFDAAWKVWHRGKHITPGTIAAVDQRGFENELQRQHRAALDALRAEVRNQQIEAFSGMLKADKALYEKCLDTPGFAYWFNRAAVPPVVFVAAALPLPEVTK